MIREIWKVCEESQIHDVSNLGKIRNRITKKIIKPRNNGNGYKTFSIRTKGKKKNVFIHRAVLNAFQPNNIKRLDVNHLDFNKSNNNINNLEWVTRKQNILYSRNNGRCKNADRHRSQEMKRKHSEGKIKHFYNKDNGYLNPMAKKVKSIINGITIKKYRSIKEAERLLNICRGSIGRSIRRGQKCKKLVWKYL